MINIMLTKDDLEAIQLIVNQSISKALVPVNKKLNKVCKNLDLVIRTFDKDIIETKRRVDRIEKHLDLPPLQTN